MSYSDSVCYCRECVCMDLNDRSPYNSNKAWCSAKRKYYNLNDHACSPYFQYDGSKGTAQSGCHLTTVICNMLGIEDKKGILQVIRNFRDEYLLIHPENYSMLMEYDVVDLKIVNALTNDPLQIIIAKSLYDDYIVPITQDILLKNYKVAISKYSNMTQKLRNIYQIDSTITKNLDVNIKTLGKERT